MREGRGRRINSFIYSFEGGEEKNGDAGVI